MAAFEEDRVNAILLGDSMYTITSTHELEIHILKLKGDTVRHIS